MPLVLADRRAESHVPLGLPQQFFEPLHPLPVIILHELVELLEAGEHGAGR